MSSLITLRFNMDGKVCQVAMVRPTPADVIMCAKHVVDSICVIYDFFRGWPAIVEYAGESEWFKPYSWRNLAVSPEQYDCHVAINIVGAPNGSHYIECAVKRGSGNMVRCWDDAEGSFGALYDESTGKPDRDKFAALADKIA